MGEARTTGHLRRTSHRMKRIGRKRPDLNQKTPSLIYQIRPHPLNPPNPRSKNSTPYILRRLVLVRVEHFEDGVERVGVLWAFIVSPA